ncbi:MAG: metal ABC transporter permease [Pirellulales bacterium]
MMIDIIDRLRGWGSLDTLIVLTAALSAMACALPGVFLVLKRQSMMGDALSHTVLPGIVCAFLFAHALAVRGWISPASYDAAQHAIMMLGAAAIGVFSAVLTEWLQRVGRVEATAALGVVFTTLFALGLLLIRVAADNVHIDPDCVLYGTLEIAVYGQAGVPRAVWINGGVLSVNLVLVIAFYKELRVAAFDPALATTLGIPARGVHYVLMAMTAVTLVAAFESVGSILVIAMLIAPAATASLLTERLSRMIGLSLIFAAAAAVVGHGMAISLPPVLFSGVGFPSDGDASTAGMMAVACGSFFLAAVLFSPRQGVLGKILHAARFRLRIAAEDVLGSLYRHEEAANAAHGLPQARDQAQGISPWLRRLATWRLTRQGLLAGTASSLHLTPAGQLAGEELVRSHRLWESYMARHFPLPEDHLHDTAAVVEHYLGRELQEQLAEELESPATDPHGRAIPPVPAIPSQVADDKR